MPIRGRRGGWVLALATVLPALLLGGGAMIVYAHRQIGHLVRGELVGRYPTRVYSAEFRARAGEALTPAELEGRLKRLGYEPVSGPPPKPGAYRRVQPAAGRDRFEISLRGFTGPSRTVAPVEAAVELEGGRVSAVLRLPEGVPLVEASLEPELVYELSGAQRVRREPVSWSEIPKQLADAVVAVEDRRFRAHHGVDLRGTARAALRNFARGRISEGGSTLSQQLARNLFLSPERTLSRKVREALFALYLELRFPKDEILRMYLDQVYFGQDGPVSVCGVKAASRFFFNKSPADLKLGEAALLAGMLQSPFRYNPFRDPDLSLQRRQVVLQAMREQGYIASADELAARLEPLKITRAGHMPPRSGDFFVAYVQELLLRRYSDENLITRGLTIHTTMDPWLEEAAQRAVAKAKHQAALVAVDPVTGAIRAMTGGRHFAESPFNRAVSARRQPGSAFKPFVYGAALRRARADGTRWTAASLLLDEKKSFRIAKGDWAARNYDGVYHGTVTFRAALALSLNAATVQLTAAVGPRSVIDYARTMGIASPLKPEIGLALGVFEVNLLEITGSYAPFANGGWRIEPYAIEKILDLAGNSLEIHAAQPAPALSPQEAWLMTDLLREVVRTGTARALAGTGLETAAAGKTGTTDQGKDAWFVGYTPRLVCGVWTGEDKPTPLKMSGASGALPMWAAFMKESGLGVVPRGTEPWPRPDGISIVKVDPASGLKANAGCPERRAEFFLAGTEPAQDCPLHPGGIKGFFKRLFRKK